MASPLPLSWRLPAAGTLVLRAMPSAESAAGEGPLPSAEAAPEEGNLLGIGNGNVSPAFRVVDKVLRAVL